MRILWTLMKVIIGLAIAIPLGIIGLVFALGILGGLLGLAFLVLKLAVFGVVGYGLFRVARYFLAPAAKATTTPPRELPMPDPYYQAAMRISTGRWATRRVDKARTYHLARVQAGTLRVPALLLMRRGCARAPPSGLVR
jgi:hypothetical protein